MMRRNNAKASTLVLGAMRLAERVHRTRKPGPHLRKAPDGEDRPPYFIHLAEVGWMLQNAGLDAETVAAGYLHDVIEDCGYTKERLLKAIGNRRVVALVSWVTEPGNDGHGKKKDWTLRNDAYLRRMKRAPREALALSCADKTSNLRDMVRLLRKKYRVDDFTSKDHVAQLGKFEKLDAVYRGQVPRKLLAAYREILAEFRSHG